MNRNDFNIDVDKILFTKEAIDSRIRELGKEISDYYRTMDLMVLVVLKGSFVFAADLIRSMRIPMSVEFIGLRSYGSRTSTSGVVEITLDVNTPLNGKHVLIVEDIVDTGLTINYLMQNLSTRRPASLRLAALVHKPSRTLQEVSIDFLGFTIPDEFIVGYGLDFDGRYRNLPYIGALKT